MKWIKHKYIPSKSENTLADIRNKVELIVIEKTSSGTFLWYGFPEYTQIEMEDGSLLYLRELPQLQAAKPAFLDKTTTYYPDEINLKEMQNTGPEYREVKQVEGPTLENGNNTVSKDINYQLWTFHVGAINIGDIGNWDTSAVKKRMKNSMPVKDIVMVLTGRGLFAGHKQANVWAKYPQDWSKIKVKAETVKAINHGPIKTPKISGLKQANSYEDNPKSTNWLEGMTGVKGEYIKWIGGGFLVLYALNTYSKIKR